MFKLDDLLLKKSVLVRSNLDHFSHLMRIANENDIKHACFDPFFHLLRIANENYKKHTCISVCRFPL